MRAFVKVALTTVGLLLILLGVLGILFFTQAQSLVTKAVEEVIAEAFGSDASIQSVSISPTETALSLRGFALSNPDGFRDGDALTCSRVRIKLRSHTVFSGTPVIEHMELEGADIRYRYEVGRGTNVGAIVRALSDRPATESRRFKVERLTCRDARVHLSANIIPAPDFALNVIAIDLVNLGEGASITTAKTTSIFLRSVLMETLTLNGLFTPMVNAIREELKRSEG